MNRLPDESSVPVSPLLGAVDDLPSAAGTKTDRPTQALYPVILCGGGGTRLWPASRPSRPKQFLRLFGQRSLFQDAVLRMAPLAEAGGRVLVIGGVAHRNWILDQLAELGVEAQILLEPEARDSAPAMAAAAAWVARADPTGVAAFVASDHHVPDHDAFRAAVVEAGGAAAKGRIVTLGRRHVARQAAARRELRRRGSARLQPLSHDGRVRSACGRRRAAEVRRAVGAGPGMKTPLAKRRQTSAKACSMSARFRTVLTFAIVSRCR